MTILPPSPTSFFFSSLFHGPPPPPTPSLFPSLLSSHSMFRTAVHAHPHTHATHSQQHAVQDIVTAPKKLERVIKKLEDEMTEIRKARR